MVQCTLGFRETSQDSAENFALLSSTEIRFTPGRGFSSDCACVSRIFEAFLDWFDIAIFWAIPLVTGNEFPSRV